MRCIRSETLGHEFDQNGVWFETESAGLLLSIAVALQHKHKQNCPCGSNPSAHLHAAEGDEVAADYVLRCQPAAMLRRATRWHLHLQAAQQQDAPKFNDGTRTL
jgi:hypothetical protein